MQVEIPATGTDVAEATLHDAPIKGAHNYGRKKTTNGGRLSAC